MKRLAASISIAALAAGAALISDRASAAPSEHLDWGYNLAASNTACPPGLGIVNVNQKIINDVDSAVGGGYWAFDEEVRHINVVDLGGGAYCATVQYQGSFETEAGGSPQNTGTVGAGVVGTFQGGYTAMFTATSVIADPAVRTKGSIGTNDYQCDITGNCPGYVDWTSLYFTGVGAFDLPWWGWVYHAGNNGSWVNASSGNSGDITGD